MTKIIFAMYNPDTDCVEISLLTVKNAMLTFGWTSLLILHILQG